jgi:hypothetical protein
VLFFGTVDQIIICFRALEVRVDLLLATIATDVLVLVIRAERTALVQFVSIFVIQSAADLTGKTLTGTFIGDSAPFTVDSELHATFEARLTVNI